MVTDDVTIVMQDPEAAGGAIPSGPAFQTTLLYWPQDELSQARAPPRPPPTMPQPSFPPTIPSPQLLGPVPRVPHSTLDLLRPGASL